MSNASVSEGLPGWVAQARARWPALVLGEAEFRSYLEAVGRPAPVFPVDAYLAAACAATGRWEFLFTMAPLRIPGGTGCPVNPVAVL